MATTTEFDEAWLKEYCQRTGQRNPLEGQARTEPTGAKGKGRKYRNEPTMVDGIRFDSKREAERYGQLKLLARGGDICGFSRQQPFLLPGGIRYVADFVVLRRDGTYQIEDAKGVRTKEYKIKKRLMKSHLGIEVVEV